MGHRRFGAIVLGAALLVSGCGASSPGSAGNATVDFIESIQTGDHGQAYDRLCEERRAAVPESEFAATEGGTFGDPARLETGLLEETQYPDEETLSKDVTVAWTEVEGVHDGRLQTWRFTLVREDGRWRVCDVVLRSEGGSRTGELGP